MPIKRTKHKITNLIERISTNRINRLTQKAKIEMERYKELKHRYRNPTPGQILLQGHHSNEATPPEPRIENLIPTEVTTYSVMRQQRRIAARARLKAKKARNNFDTGIWRKIIGKLRKPKERKLH